MNILTKFYLIAAPLALVLFMSRRIIMRIIMRIILNAREIGGVFMDLAMQAFIDFTNLFKRRAKTAEPEEFEKFYHE